VKGTIVAERAVDMICLVIVTFITILLQAEVVGSYALALFHMITGSPGENMNTKGLFIFIAAVLIVMVVLYILFKKFRQKNWFLKLKLVLKGVYDGLLSIRNVPRKNLFILHSVLIWILYLLSIQIGFYALKETEGLGITVALSVLSFGSLGMLVPTQGTRLLPVCGTKDITALWHRRSTWICIWLDFMDCSNGHCINNRPYLLCVITNCKQK
jgi:hypothetical protein